MAKATSQFVCQQCGAIRSKWVGRCDNCGEWNSFVEQVTDSSMAIGGNLKSSGKALLPTPVSKVSDNATRNRTSTKIKDVDDVLGGGIVPASVILLAGQPGIGKSTILTQIAHSVAMTDPVLYVSGEESAEQIKARASRLGALSDQLLLASSVSADDIASTISTGKYKLVIVDSIQTIATAGISSGPGSVSQVTNCLNLLSQVAKAHNTSLIIVGHVTKEGSIAGPKLLEHLVDVVLNLEGDRYGGFKVLRAVKNRYGSTNEAGIFEMGETGLEVVANPSAALLAERQATDGSVVLVTMEGTRPLLVEVQALVNKTSFGYPKRTASGFDLNRLNLLIAVLERRTSLSLSESDVYINVVGGIRLNDPAADLAICMAIATSARERRLEPQVAVLGEVGLSGEIRRVPHIEKRCKEAEKLGFTTVIGPNYQKNPTNLASVHDLRDALNTYLQK
ncbi:MAG TPA: DNA repair protein RadA [Candidatus Saccharimonadales bacterium]|nr:DNA repair protein RadA [Candidatus Saccharimonadales bacterium]